MTKTYKRHTRFREYMSGIDRDKLRIKQTAEVFTPTKLVQEMLDKLEEQDPTLFTDPNKTFLDNSCGDGQFLTEVVIRKMERSGCSLEQALRTTYGVDLMEDNVDLCRERLAGSNPTPEILEIVNKNIVCADALTYDYSFYGDIVLDPFTGSGTTLKIAKNLGRNYIGYELYHNYENIINLKLNEK